MESTPTIASLAVALSKAQAVMKHAEKDGMNPHFGKRYATLASIWDACRAALTNNGLSVVQLTGIEGPVITLRTVLMHASGEWIASTLATTPQQAGPQQLGSTISYLRRYALSSLIGICADEDDDGNAATHSPTKASHAEAPSRPKEARPAGDAKAPVQPAAPAPAPAAAAPKPLSDTQRWNVAVATIRNKLGQAAGDKLLADITAKHMDAGEVKVSDAKRPALIAELETAAKGGAK